MSSSVAPVKARVGKAARQRKEQPWQVRRRRHVHPAHRHVQLRKHFRGARREPCAVPKLKDAGHIREDVRQRGEVFAGVRMGYELRRELEHDRSEFIGITHRRNVGFELRRYGAVIAGDVVRKLAVCLDAEAEVRARRELALQQYQRLFGAHTLEHAFALRGGGVAVVGEVELHQRELRRVVGEERAARPFQRRRVEPSFADPFRVVVAARSDVEFHISILAEGVGEGIRDKG
jgi:hypothetical protein